MDRRAFFRRGLKEVAEVAVKHVDAQVSRQARRWIRPPYALDELEFLLACTRCEACAEACPQQLIFPLPARLSAQVAGTPALDLLNRGCRLCPEWPCVTACEPGALRRPDSAQDESGGWPELAVATLDTRACLPYLGPECGACAGSCPVPGALLWEGERPRIDADLCVGCGSCREACILEPRAIEIRTLPTDVSTSANTVAPGP